MRFRDSRATSRHELNAYFDDRRDHCIDEGINDGNASECVKKHIWKRLLQVDQLIASGRGGRQASVAKTSVATKKSGVKGTANRPKKLMKSIGYTSGRYVMLLDTREIGGIRSSTDLESLSQTESWCVPQWLAIGDMMWAYSCQQIFRSEYLQGPSVEERRLQHGRVEHVQKYFPTGVVIERKTYRDLSASIRDTRYEDQIKRLKLFREGGDILTPITFVTSDGSEKDIETGFVILLVEKSKLTWTHPGQERRGDGVHEVSIKALETAILKYQLRDQFLVVLSQSTKHTADLLRCLEKKTKQSFTIPCSVGEFSSGGEDMVALNQKWSQEGLEDVVDEDLDIVEDRQNSGQGLDGVRSAVPRLSLNTSLKVYKKSAHIYVGQVYRKQLRLVSHKS
ncbi:hypothetical protein GNI_021270 [Gregarina niphandrodes]|uniref:Crossover junction endonuclease MUS81 n=1 Tax=Gregarina niphandrodes TaxID=110365 RepID=A0A023BBX9_GRENI|nr:hypothetical protein GNI_021270 [Gregarina niphandrodes]EZG80580.1 hypothetical protein GNI_021270 [Gregarina niphandrodes]|eukprot:XP_011134292.1 hypothetical protein GNI_021270 [Gregarina niphandrodes]